jgi:hypothetical protein
MVVVFVFRRRVEREEGREGGPRRRVGRESTLSRKCPPVKEQRYWQVGPSTSRGVGSGSIPLTAEMDVFPFRGPSPNFLVMA